MNILRQEPVNYLIRLINRENQEALSMCARQREHMVKPPRKPNLRWLSAANRCFHVRGLPWYEENDRRFDRLPARAEPVVSDNVRVLHHGPASANVAFGTDSTTKADVGDLARAGANWAAMQEIARRHPGFWHPGYANSQLRPLLDPDGEK